MRREQNKCQNIIFLREYRRERSEFDVGPGLKFINIYIKVAIARQIWFGISGSHQTEQYRYSVNLVRFGPPLLVVSIVLYDKFCFH